MILDIRIHQRNARKTLTTIQGLGKEFDPKRILKQFRIKFGCNGTIVEDEVYGDVIQLQGDHRSKVGQFLLDEEIIKKDHLKIHGF